MKIFKLTVKHPILLSLILLVALAVSIWVALTLKHNSSELVAPKIGPIAEAIYGIGTVTSERKYTFRPGVTNSLKTVFVAEGDQVKKGQALLQLDDNIRVKSPFDGTVTSLHYFTGENVPPQAAVVEVQDLDALYLEASLEQQGAIRVARGMPVRLLFESIRGKTFTGTVKSIYPKEKQFLVHVDVRDLPKAVLPGMTADIAIQVSQRENALLVPSKAIQSGQVVVLRNQKRVKLRVEVGSVDDQWAEIKNDSVRVSDLIYVKK